MSALVFATGSLTAVAITAAGFLFIALLVYPPTVISKFFRKRSRWTKLATRLALAFSLLLASGYGAYATLSRL